jgi:[acyl-carrier-protein] S-malonyltransferase
MPADKVSEIAADAAQGEVCQAANLNSPEQIVISGNTGAVGRAVRLAHERGAKKAVSLPVSAPFHCSLMQPAQDRLAEDLRGLSFAHPSRTVVCNADAAVVSSSEAARAALIRQVTGTVKWEPSIRLLIDQGASLFIEVGPGKVLWGLMRQIDRSKTCLSVGDKASLQKTLAQLAGLAA